MKHDWSAVVDHCRLCGLSRQDFIERSGGCTGVPGALAAEYIAALRRDRDLRRALGFDLRR